MKPEITVFAGPNGSGKSTITEILKPTYFYSNGETILMKCVVVHNHDDLVWYDFKASSLIKLDYKK